MSYLLSLDLTFSLIKVVPGGFHAPPCRYPLLRISKSMSSQGRWDTDVTEGTGGEGAMLLIASLEKGKSI